MCTRKRHNFKLTIAYDGGHFYGWQKSAMGPSVEDTLQTALEKVVQEGVSLQAASRTDSGVHAYGQVVNFFTSKEKVNLLSVNQLLPQSLVVREIEMVEESFHPTLDCVGKEYHYLLCYGLAQLPHHRHTAWHAPCPRMNVAAMQQAAKYLVGKHDFSAFCLNRKQAEYGSCVREIERITICPLGGERLCVKVVGKTFFYQMVRTLVGTLVAVGKGKKEALDVAEMLKSCDRRSSGMTAPAHGLTLYQVDFSLRPHF